jgi:hypothetical protein
VHCWGAREKITGIGNAEGAPASEAEDTKRCSEKTGDETPAEFGGKCSDRTFFIFLGTAVKTSVKVACPDAVVVRETVGIEVSLFTTLNRALIWSVLRRGLAT